MSDTTKALAFRSRPLWLRVVGTLCALVTAWHIFATFLWIAPASELRNVVPSKGFYGYMNPMFSQSWNVFAPEPVNGDYLLEVRAISTDENGKAYTTEWVDAANREMSLTHHNFFPARATLAGTQAASEYRRAWNKLSDNQQEVVGWNYYDGDDWRERLDNKLKERAGDNSGAVKKAQEFAVKEHEVNAYATQVARAIWGDSVKQIQYRVGRQGIIPFDKRNDPDAVRPKPSYITAGWRGQEVVDGQNDDNFAKIFNSLTEVK